MIKNLAIGTAVFFSVVCLCNRLAKAEAAPLPVEIVRASASERLSDPHTTLRMINQAPPKRSTQAARDNILEKAPRPNAQKDIYEAIIDDSPKTPRHKQN